MDRGDLHAAVHHGDDGRSLRRHRAHDTPDRYAYKGDFPVSMLSSEDGRFWSAAEQPELEGSLFHRLAEMADGQVLAIRQLNDITWLGRPADAPP